VVYVWNCLGSIVDGRVQLVSRQMIDYALIEYELILEEAAKLPRASATDTCGTIPSALDLLYQRLLDYDC
jgi:hypothetical protein